MGKSNISTIRFLIILLFFISLAMTASNVSAATCYLLPLAPCLPAAQKDGPAPSAACCRSIQKVSPTCLCQGVQSSMAINNHVDIPTALSIPQSCGLKALIPKGYTCAGYKVPGG